MRAQPAVTSPIVPTKPGPWGGPSPDPCLTCFSKGMIHFPKKEKGRNACIGVSSGTNWKERLSASAQSSAGRTGSLCEPLQSESGLELPCSLSFILKSLKAFPWLMSQPGLTLEGPFYRTGNRAKPDQPPLPPPTNLASSPTITLLLESIPKADLTSKIPLAEEKYLLLVINGNEVYK
ncbi:hypothetical protein llap_1225 [Limosa lapponica baueri]|uniref:Uncharacterized protein n=1 Tax=Limosa lapponica baueri TaxID=1758121 RepID=A0A2I0UR11_LIMLA|nr:hypothetical protein llap_1225 [Limosa lapponica baueri]